MLTCLLSLGSANAFLLNYIFITCHALHQVLRNDETQTKEARFDTLNVCGGMDDKNNDVYGLMNDRRLEVLHLNATKKKWRLAHQTLFFETHWSGVNQSQRGCWGVDFILSKKISECVNSYEFVTPKLLWLRVKI
ncbi:hypothetical protein EVAR_63192_1 [Eumeta japonica]|uniref:Uncharacterized protein n=1 Tax=Eumeta variegata TaxID=151549 RepID=A0A4C1ZY74_EUMVA|nr:hypothetical protein EVAR_63192_1 [Eumeta japonica]